MVRFSLGRACSKSDHDVMEMGQHGVQGKGVDMARLGVHISLVHHDLAQVCRFV
jgi:hypothetical protein